jgi:protein-S-isoprenylcysteine O-methyltransferase Ste14
VGYAAVAPVLWLLSDAIVYGSPLASYDTNNRINRGVPWHSVEVAVRYFGNALRADTGQLVLIAGLLGFGLAAVQRRWRPDPFLACVLVVLPLTLVATWLHLPYNTRYTFPAAVLLPLGCAHLGGLVPLPRWLSSRAIAAAVVSLAILAWGAHTMPRAIYLRHVAKFTTEALHSGPKVSRALDCGTLGVDARPHSWFFTIRLAGITRHPLADFRWAKQMTGPADVAQTSAVIIGPHPTPSIAAWVANHGWHPARIKLGTLWTSPKCG